MFFFFLMIRRPPRSTRTDTLFPYTTLFRSVNYASPSSGKVEEWEWMDDGTLRTLPLRGRVTVNSAEAYIACCLAGLGLIQIPAYDVRHHLEAGELVEVMSDHRAEAMPMTLLYPHRQHLARRVQLFTDWLEALLRREVVGR